MLKLQRKARTFVLGTSTLNNVAPNNSERNKEFTCGNYIASLTNLAKKPVLEGHSRGQYAAEGHHGTTMDPFALQACAWQITLGTKPIEGHNRLFSPDQLTMNASTASEPGFQHLLLNRAPDKCGNSKTIY